jgi:hypothetical protein
MQRHGDPARWRPILWVSYKVARGGAGDRRDWSAAIALASLCASERSKRWRGPSRPSRRRSVLWSPTQWPVTGRRAGRCDRRSRRRFRGAAPADRRLCDGPNFHPADAIACSYVKRLSLFACFRDGDRSGSWGWAQVVVGAVSRLVGRDRRRVSRSEGLGDAREGFGSPGFAVLANLPTSVGARLGPSREADHWRWRGPDDLGVDTLSVILAGLVQRCRFDCAGEGR